MSNKQDIKVLNDREHVLLRPGMYIGRTTSEVLPFWFFDGQKIEKREIDYIPGQFKLFCEILDNAIDEHIRGFGDKIDISVDIMEGDISIRDYGRGIPIEMHPQQKVYTPQVVYTELKSGSNFDDSDRKTAGMNGVGASLATIFSDRLCVEIFRDGYEYKQCYSNNMSVIGKPSIQKTKRKDTGTKVTYKLSEKIFGSIIPPIDLIKKRIFELSHKFEKLEFNLEIKGDSLSEPECIKYNNSKFEDLVKLFSDSSYILKTKEFSLAVCLNEKTEAFDFFSNVNGVDTWRGGTHIEAIKELFCSEIKDKIKKDYKLEVSTSDVAKNMIIVLLMDINAPQFEGQTKEKLGMDKKTMADFFSEITSRKIAIACNDSLSSIASHTFHDVTAKNDKKFMEELKKKQKTLDKKRIAKLIDCSSKNRNECSIYITEGDSAISNLATVRDAKTMAGLPLRGKILNVYDSSLKEVIENKEIQALVAAIGLKFGEPSFQKNSHGKVVSSSLSYGKIIIATDQDMDGYSIRCLLVNFFYKYWPDLFENGVIKILETPLYEAIEKKTGNSNYFYDKQEYEAWTKNKNLSKYEISYFKGLGSCGREAWDYMINKNPNLVTITSPDSKITKDILDMAFGEDSEKRKKWLAD